MEYGRYPHEHMTMLQVCHSANEKGRRKAINIAAVSGLTRQPLVVAHSAFEGRVTVLTQKIGAELAPFGVRCNSIGLASDETVIADGLSKQAFELYGDTEKREVAERIFNSAPANGSAGPSDIAHAALNLASDESATITGANLLIDGSSRPLVRGSQHF